MTLFNIQLPDWPQWRRRKRSVILVEDNADDSFLIMRALVLEGFNVVTVKTSEEAIGMLHANGKRFVMVMADIGLGQSISGWQLREVIRARWPAIITVIVTGGVTNLHNAPRGQLLLSILKDDDLQAAIRELKKLL